MTGVQTCSSDLSRATADAYRADDQEVIRKNQPKRHIIEQGRSEDGTPIWVDTTKTPLVDASGEPYGVLGVYDDITERKLAEEAIHTSNKRYRLLFETLSEGVALNEIVYDESGGNG